MNEDLISRQAAIREFENMPNNYSGFSDTYDKSQLIGILEELPSAEPQWIPCSKRLPKKNGKYLVTRGVNVAGAIWKIVDIVNYSDLTGVIGSRIFWQVKGVNLDFEKLEDVIAWLPIPKPWKGEAND